MADILFLDQTTPFDGQSLRDGPLGGIQSGTVLLAEAFARAGHRVRAYTATTRTVEIEGVTWAPLAGASRLTGDLAISNNRPELFAAAPGVEPVVWWRNRTSFSRLLKKKGLWPLLRHRPHGVFLSRYHRDLTHPMLSMRSRRIIEHGVADVFRREDIVIQAPAPRAMFTSQPYRGLEWLVDVWRTRIVPQVPEAELHVFTPKSVQSPEWLDVFAEEGIRRRESVNKEGLAAELRWNRVMLYPGHKDETYCNAAAEATASGLPIVTRGEGSLAERVRQGETGFIEPDPEGFARAAIRLLTDDALWLDQHRAALSEPAIGSWDARAREWERHFLTPHHSRSDRAKL